MNRMILVSLITAQKGWDFGSKATLNEEFKEFDAFKKLPFNRLIGEYVLDINSKKRYKLVKDYI
ncbi:MAG: hypothetical protein LBE36_01660 [Flavobacteriaceae bacterium]|jgi:hypothetical protein|nr:hypothetical protein [Flavobacteriaceae bacterium]